MVTNWEYSNKTEAERLVHCAHQVAVGFYRINNFIVLPYTPKAKNSLFVTFPDLDYNKIPRFWEKVKKIQVTDFPMQIEAKLLEEVRKLIKDTKLPKPDYQDTKKVWQEAEKEIISSIYKLMPEKAGQIKKITIHPTCFGTSCSFNWFNPQKGEIILYLRQDMGIYQITEAIITSLTRGEIYKDLGGIWQESEVITDWILNKSFLSNIIKKHARKEEFAPTVKGTRTKQHAKLLARSNEFYKRLGLPVDEKVFNLNGLTPEIHEKPVENLSSKEKILLRLLIQKSGSVVTFDEFGNNMFKDEADFSLYAISKSIERLRNKLEENGISGSYIQTLRGRGYLLKN